VWVKNECGCGWVYGGKMGSFGNNIEYSDGENETGSGKSNGGGGWGGEGWKSRTLS